MDGVFAFRIADGHGLRQNVTFAFRYPSSPGMNSCSSNTIAAGSSPDLWLSGSEVRQHRASGWAEQGGNPPCQAGHPCLVDVSDTLWTRLMTFPLSRFLHIFCFLRYMARTAISFTGVNGHNTRWPWAMVTTIAFFSQSAEEWESSEGLRTGDLQHRELSSDTRKN